LETLLTDDMGFSKFRFIASFLVGGLAGATAALLLAPSSGRHTRRSIRWRLRDQVVRGRTAGARLTGGTREGLEGASRYLGRQRAEREPQHDGHVAAREAHEAEGAS
jgi:hypothetical protein